MTQQPPTNVQYQPQPPAGSGLGVASLVLGIIACVVFCLPPLAGLLALIAIVLGVIAMSQAGPAGNGKAKAGLILGVLAIVLGIGFYIAVRAGLTWAGKKAQESGNSWQKQIDDAMKKAEEEQKKAEERMKRDNPSSQPGAVLVHPLGYLVVLD